MTMTKHVRGSEHSMTSLTEDDVREIRRLYDSKEMRTPALGRKYGLTRQAAWMIVNRRTWKHVQ